MYRYAIFALVLCAAVVAEDPACPDVKSVDNFRYKDYAQGKWFEYLRYGASEETGKCSSTSYTPDGDHFKIKDCNVKNGKKICLDAYGQLSPDAGNTGRIIYTSPYGHNNAITPALVNILDTDYDNYSIMYYCKYIPEISKRKEIAWVLTRSKVLSDDIKSAIDKSLKASVLGDKQFKNIDLSEEACKYE